MVGTSVARSRALTDEPLIGDVVIGRRLLEVSVPYSQSERLKHFSSGLQDEHWSLGSPHPHRASFVLHATSRYLSRGEWVASGLKYQEWDLTFEAEQCSLTLAFL